MTRTHDIGRWLHETAPERLEALWSEADRVRREVVGDAVYLRGLIEVSNHCACNCAYCGIRAGNHALDRYRMSADEIIDAAGTAAALGYGTVVLQAGEDLGITGPWMADVVRRIKDTLGLAVTLSLGERPTDDLEAWRDAGADRYLLRFETSNEALFRRIRPGAGGPQARLRKLGELRSLGYEVGTGVMVGIPGQTYADLECDLMLLREIDPHMIGCGPYVSHPQTPLGRALGDALRAEAGSEQVLNDERTTCKVLALARLLCPFTNIPSTTALSIIGGQTGRAHGLMRGANIVMPNVTPTHYRELYEIYLGKADAIEAAEPSHRSLCCLIESLGRQVGIGRGDSPLCGRERRPAAEGYLTRPHSQAERR